MNGELGYTLELHRRNWWALVLRGLVALTFGVLAFVWPRLTLSILVFLFGAYAVADGILALIHASLARRGDGRVGGLVFNGLASLVAGLLAFFWPGITGVVLLLIIAGWAIATGALEIITAIELRKVARSPWMLGLAGLVSLIFGFVILAQPALGALAVAWWIGGFALVFGALLIAVGLRFRRLSRWLTPTTEGTPLG